VERNGIEWSGAEWNGMEHKFRSIVWIFSDGMKQKYHSIIWKVNGMNYNNFIPILPLFKT
jgi:hypothetical protein